MYRLFLIGLIALLSCLPASSQSATNIVNLYNYSTGAPPAFAPSDIATCMVWLDMSDTGTITQSSGSVSQVDDKCSGANHATQATGANQPVTGTHTINGLNALKFDGSNDHLALPSALLSWHNQTTGTVFAVAVANTFSPDRYLWSGESTGAANVLFAQTRGTDIVRFRAFSSATTGTNITSTTSGGAIRIWSTRKDSGTNRPYMDGVPVTTQSSGQAALSNFLIGTSTLFPTQTWDGTIGEFIVYQDTLTPTQMNQVGNYLAAKWGVTWTTVANIPANDNKQYANDNNFIEEPRVQWASIK